MAVSTQNTIAALIVAGGSGERAGLGFPKQYAELNGIPMLRQAVDAFLRHPRIGMVQVVRQDAHAERCARALSGLQVLPPVSAGATRQASVRRGLEALASHVPDAVLIHDAARPFVSAALIDRVIAAIDAGEAAVVPALPVSDTIKQVHESRVERTLPRTTLAAVQTPQGFDFNAILALHRRATHIEATDDAMLAEQAGMRVALVAGEAANRKLTHADDFTVSADRPAFDIRTGNGFDVHRFAPPALAAAEVEETVRLCGVAIPHPQPLEGHSDADVGLHALTDALLGALGLGDIGTHFPPSDERWKGMDSARFLAHAATLAAERGARILHLDVTIICESPRIGPHRDAMRARVSEILAIDPDRVSVKATTTEGLGFTGRGEGIAALATATLGFQ